MSKIVPRELPAIVRWALRGAVRLMTQREYTIPTSHELAMARWRGTEDSVRLFMESQTRPCEPKERGERADSLFNAYTKWAAGFGPPQCNSAEAFGRTLTAKGYAGTRSSSGMRYAVQLLGAVHVVKWSEGQPTQLNGRQTRSGCR